MGALIDTTVWSIALRRRRETLGAGDQRIVTEFVQLVESGEAYLTGAIRQEVLSGVRDPVQFDRLRSQLDGCPCLPTTLADHDDAASFFNRLMKAGIAATHIDLLVCAVAVRHRVSVFTTDADFARYAKHLPITLHKA